ncbi:MAG: hypothetical protein NVSMB25_06580 [Thermoleophilaceae bacterium]
MPSKRFASITAAGVAALALALPSMSVADKGGVPHNGHGKQCPQHKHQGKHNGAGHGKKKGATRGKKCGQQV